MPALQDISNTLEQFYNRQVDAAEATDLTQYDSYFMDLENSILPEVSNDIQNLAMNARNERHLIPEWYAAIKDSMDYNLGAGPAGLMAKMVMYTKWVEAGFGDDWFVHTDDEDQYRPNSDDDDDLQTQHDEDSEAHYTQVYNDTIGE